jgi:hypothetical protein
MIWIMASRAHLFEVFPVETRLLPLNMVKFTRSLVFPQPIPVWISPPELMRVLAGQFWQQPMVSPITLQLLVAIISPVAHQWVKV